MSADRPSRTEGAKVRSIVSGGTVPGQFSGILADPNIPASGRTLPVGWCWAKISDVCSRVQDGTHTSPKEQTRVGNFKYITAKNIKHWGLDLSDVTYVPESVHREIYSRCKVEKGDVLYIKDGATTGIATVNPLQEEFSLLSSVAVMKPHRSVLDPQFLAYYLNSPEGYRNMTGQMTGTAMKRLTLAKIKAALVPIAPLTEQRKIVEELEKHVTRLDVGVAALERLRFNLKRYRATVLKAACEGRLVSIKAKMHSANALSTESGDELLTRILDTRRRTWAGKGEYKEPVSPELKNLPIIPKNWAWASIDEIGEVQLGRQRSPEHVSNHYPTKYLRAANITDRGIDISDVLEMEFSPLERERFALKHGDIVLSEASGSPSHVGKPAIWRNDIPLCCFQNTVIRLRPQIIHSSFALLVMKHLFTSGEFARMATGVGINHLGAKRFATIAFPLPPLEEQTLISEEAERRLSVIEGLQSVFSDHMRRATSLRQSILQRGFSGKLVSHRPDDISVEEVLNRVRTKTKSASAPKKPQKRQPRAMPSETITTLTQLLNCIDSLGGKVTPDQLLLAAGLGDDVEKFFDLLREGRDSQVLLVPIGETGFIRRNSDAN